MSVQRVTVEHMFDEAVDVIDVAGWPDTWRPDREPDHARPENPFADVRLVDGEPVPRPTPATTAPSGAFALELDWATAHPEMLTAAELVDAVVGYERLAAWAVARQQELLAAFHRRPADGSIRPTASSNSAEAREWAVDEIGLALTLAPAAAATRMAHADRADTVLRPTRELLAAGRICAGRARLVADMLAEYDDQIAAAVQARVLPRAPEQTWGQLRAALSRAITAVVPDPAKRHRAARRGRRVEMWPAADGMATLAAYLTATEATASYEWITRLARGVQPGVCGGTSNDSGSTSSAENAQRAGRGSMDRRRADVLVALLTGRLVATAAPAAAPTTTAEPADGIDDSGQAVIAAPVSAHRPLIHVTVPITTLLGVDDEPGELAGYGPLPAPIARQIAADPQSTWRRLLTDPDSGTLLDYGRTTYRPPAGLAAFVRARDRHCRYPGCRRPAVACELDHVQPWQHGGTTGDGNLCALCERHHDLKEHPAWHVVLHPDRSLEWVTPTGHRYTSRPADHRPPEPPRPEAQRARRRSPDDLFVDPPPRSDPDAQPPF